MTSKFSIEYPQDDEFFLLKHLTLLSPETGLPHTDTHSIMLTINEIPEVVKKLNEYANDANKNRNNRIQSTD
jgi:tetrahydromethanopterin S-methyltransferase subunit B